MNILVSGALGRMGKEVINCINNDPGLELICGFDHQDSFIRSHSRL